MKALITGASSGLGRDMAKVLAEKGYDLILVARRENRLIELQQEIEQRFKTVKVSVIVTDLSVKENCYALYEQTKGENIHLLINNAGFGLYGRFTETDLDTELRMINTNIVALHILTKLFLKDFVKRNSGMILNVASSAGYMAGPLMSTYYATKNYVRRMTQAIRQELKEQHSDVIVSALCPGPVNTEFNEVADVRFSIDGLASEFVAKYAIEQTFQGKLCIIPGKMMKAGVFCLRFIPESLMLKISSNIQHRKS
ncbi:MAG: SDR family oxidoreductase [Clostridia bacterium]|nr:SDR family oxidoreductase [Clostridia bacterium]